MNLPEWLAGFLMVTAILLVMYVLIALGARGWLWLIRWFEARERKEQERQWDEFDWQIAREREELKRNRQAAIRAWQEH